MVNFVLCMIVKNESKIIDRCIESSIKLPLSGISICDTGSTDNTVDLISQYGSKSNINTVVWHHKWEDFGRNRSQSFTSLVQFCKERELPLKETYGVLLDADMVLRIGKNFKPETLTKAGYRIFQRTPNMEYSNMRLVRCDVKWVCLTETHEYWAQDCSAGDPEQECGDLDTDFMYIDDLNDGGSKSDKYERDIKLLLKGLEEFPDSDRRMFYLANSYKDCGKFAEAIPWYRKRIEKKGWIEEVFYAKFHMGKCYELLGDHETAAGCYIEAWNYYPRRAESLHALANMYRKMGKNNAGYMFAKEGLKIPYPKGDMLFIANGVYDYDLKYELSICAFYVSGKKLDGFLASNELILSRSAPHHIKTSNMNNLQYYIEPLPNVDKIGISVNLPYLFEDDPFKGTYSPMNPSVIKVKDGYLMNVRTVNYKQENGIYTYLDGSGRIYTRNILVKYDRRLMKQWETEIVDSVAGDFQPSGVSGLEDLRIFMWNDQLYALASTRLTFDTPQIALVTINLDVKGKKSTARVSRKQLLIGPDGEDSCQKNWMPYVSNNHLYILYSHDPFTRLHYTGISTDTHNPDETFKGFTVDVSQRVQLPINMSSFRGSGSPIQYKDGWISIIHEVLFCGKRIYVHRFVVYDRLLTTVKGLSLPFYFFSKGIEYVCGFTIDHSDKNFLISMGVNDAEAYLVKISTETVDRLIINVKM